MKVLREQLKTKDFSSVYLFTGEEKFLIDVYVKRFVDTIFEGQDKMMNFDQFNLDNKDIDKIESSLETLPFFADKRVVLLENLDLFGAKNKSRNERITNALSKVSDSTICFIVEDKIDKRNKLYKLVNKSGTFNVFSFLTEKELIQYVARELSKANIKISSGDGKYFIDTVGYELRAISKEVHKLVDYVGSNEVATRQDIEAVCTKHLEAKIFELVDAVGTKNRERALFLYQDMISLKEPVTRILFMISRQISLIYEAKLMREKRMNNGQIAKEIKVPEFVVRKLVAQSERFNHIEIKDTIKQLVDLEYEFKSGRINLETGIELMILKLSS